MLDTVKNQFVNGLDLAALTAEIEAIEKDSSQALVGFNVTTRWTGQCRSESIVDGFTMAGERIARTHKIVADEPCELLGGDSAPNPQELLISAVNACMVVAYVAQATLRGVRLVACRIETEAELDMRGFLGLDEAVPSGCRRIRYSVTLDGDGSREQYEEIHQAVMTTSPNYFNMCQPVQMIGRLV